MADPALLTGVIGAIAGVTGAGATIIFSRRQVGKENEREAESRASLGMSNWAALYDAQGKEITRLHEDIDRQHADCARQLAGARREIGELRAEVAALRRLLRPDQLP